MVLPNIFFEGTTYVHYVSVFVYNFFGIWYLEGCYITEKGLDWIRGFQK